MNKFHDDNCENINISDKSNISIEHENNFPHQNNLEIKLKRYSNTTNFKSKSSIDLINSIGINKEKDNTYVSEKLNIYCLTWNLFGKSATETELNKLIPKDKFYHI